MPVIRFGKSAGPLLDLKQGFFENNEALQAEGRRLGDVYVRQPRRSACKCCDAQLEGRSFVKQDIEYVVCGRCGHLSGTHEDSDAFCTALYTDDGGAGYARNYTSADREAYETRVHNIYRPKAEFLKDALGKEGEDPSTLSFADLGAGAGYFVSALRGTGCSLATGYEVSEVQVDMAAEMIAPDAVVRHELEEVLPLARSVKADVVSMIGVLEHVQWPRDVLSALRSNKRVRYLYISVPLFSPCVMFEAVFPKVFQRQLSAGHTHLYTEKSLDWTCKEFRMERVAEWWFGTDIVDLFRAVTVELERTDDTRTLSAMWGEWFAPAIDEMQLALDSRKLASEVHMLLRFSA